MEADEMMVDTTPKAATKAGWGVVGLLASAQFIMVLDTTVMNVSISQVVADLDTTVVGLQTAITLYTLVMASLMLIGGKLGERWGAKRTFTVGLLVYGTGSLITSLSPNLAVLIFGWSLVEGLGAVLVIPAIAALTAATYEGKQRAVAYGILGGVSGASMAAGPLIGGWVSAEYSWRYVFAAESVVVVVILLFRRIVPAIKRTADKARHHGCRAVGARLGFHRVGDPALQPMGLDHAARRRPGGQRSSGDAAGAVSDPVADRDRLGRVGRLRASRTQGQGPG